MAAAVGSKLLFLYELESGICAFDSVYDGCVIRGGVDFRWVRESQEEADNIGRRIDFLSGRSRLFQVLQFSLRKHKLFFVLVCHQNQPDRRKSHLTDRHFILHIPDIKLCDRCISREDKRREKLRNIRRLYFILSETCRGSD